MLLASTVGLRAEALMSPGDALLPVAHCGPTREGTNGRDASCALVLEPPLR